MSFQRQDEILTVPLVVFWEFERHGSGGGETWLEGLSPAFYMLLGAVRLLHEYVEVRFGNIPHGLGREVDLVAFKFLGEKVRSEHVSYGVPIT